MDDATVDVNVTPFEIEDLALPHARADGERDDSFDPQATYRGLEIFPLRERQIDGRTLRNLDLLDAREWIFPDEVPTDAKVEDRAQAAELDVTLP